MAAARVADDVGLTVTVLGTPAEEVLKTGGKILLLDRGSFDGVHAAMMAHPAPWDVAMWPIVAASFFEVHYTGKAAHAAFNCGRPNAVQDLADLVESFGGAEMMDVIRVGANNARGASQGVAAGQGAARDMQERSKP